MSVRSAPTDCNGGTLRRTTMKRYEENQHWFRANQ